jgi:hypothetical protein
MKSPKETKAERVINKTGMRLPGELNQGVVPGGEAFGEVLLRKIKPL